MSGTLRERMFESRGRSNSLSKCPDPVKDAQIMEPVEVKIKTLPRRHTPLNELEIPPPPPVTITLEADKADAELNLGAGGAVYLAQPATVTDSEDNHNDEGKCLEPDHWLDKCILLKYP